MSPLDLCPIAFVVLTSNSSSSSRAPSWGSFFFSSWGLVSFSTFFSLWSAMVGEVADGTMSGGVVHDNTCVYDCDACHVTT